jgi:hypothetical protein
VVEGWGVEQSLVIVFALLLEAPHHYHASLVFLQLPILVLALEYRPFTIKSLNNNYFGLSEIK